jgi:uncharacterized membrane protein
MIFLQDHSSAKKRRDSDTQNATGFRRKEANGLKPPSTPASMAGAPMTSIVGAARATEGQAAMSNLAPGAVRRRATIVWALYLGWFLAGVTLLIGVILAYLWRGDAVGTPYESHFRRQITLFWWSLILGGIGLVLALIGIGFLILVPLAIYFFVICCLGLMRAVDEKPYS